MLEKKKKNLMVLGYIFLLLMIVFTFTDLQVALRIYNPRSMFGGFFQIVGTLPLNIIGVFGCVSLIMTADQKFNISMILSYIVGFSLLIFFGFYGCRSFVNALSEAETVIMVVAAAVAVFGPMLIKSFMSRPRFHTLENPVEQFTYWFQRMPHTELSSNSSFPSGHSSQSALSLCVLLIPMFIKRLDNQKYYKVAVAFAGAFTICVMASRMVLGAHYGTDVLFGAALTTATILALDYFISKKK